MIFSPGKKNGDTYDESDVSATMGEDGYTDSKIY